MAYKPKELADWLGVSGGTIRGWSRIYADYLSDNAQGGDRRHRVYDDQDARVIAHIHTLRRGGNTTDAIKKALQLLQDDDWQDLPELPDPPPETSQRAVMVPANKAIDAVETVRTELTLQIESKQVEIDYLSETLDNEQEAHSETRDKLLTATQEMGKLQGQVDAADRVQTATGTERDRERKLFTYLVAGLVIAAVVLLAVVVILALQTGMA